MKIYENLQKIRKIWKIFPGFYQSAKFSKSAKSDGFVVDFLSRYALQILAEEKFSDHTSHFY